MKSKQLFLCGCVIFVFSISTGCASIKDLTPSAVEDDIGGEIYLGNCQYFLSKDIELRYVNTLEGRDLTDSGTVVISRDTRRDTIRIAYSTPGILQTKNNAGTTVKDGVRHLLNKSGNELVIVKILFEKSNDDFLEFSALYDEPNDRFELSNNQITYNGQEYTVRYKGDDPPYLRYKILVKEREKETGRRAKGRRVGS
ncbi:MAG: hypothetical protein LBH75_09360 [Treponema sp.]|jgi:hypothetical protein|nr:hypothetical protein [Treponema sp.]